MKEKPLVWINTEIKTPPFSEDARIKAGVLLRRLQYGETLTMPSSRSMTSIGDNCYEMRIHDSGQNRDWRIIYHISQKAIVVLDSFKKKTNTTPKSIIERCCKRLNQFYNDMHED